jgi:hypothetical protein
MARLLGRVNRRRAIEVDLTPSVFTSVDGNRARLAVAAWRATSRQ